VKSHQLPAPGWTQSFLLAPDLTFQFQDQCWEAVKPQTNLNVLKPLETLAVLGLLGIDLQHHPKDLLCSIGLDAIQSIGSTPKKTMLTNHADRQEDLDQAATLPGNHPKMQDMAVLAHCQHIEDWMLWEE
jgi:hypothetical protein